MKTSGFDCQFSVLAVPRQSDMFLMNMNVYNVVPVRTPAVDHEKPVSVVWCAVLNVNGLRKA